MSRRTTAGSPQLGAHEHVLLRESTPDGAEHVGTNHALYVRATDVADPIWRRIGWTEVSSVGWTRETGVVILHSWSAEHPAVAVAVKDHSRLPEFAAERVTSCRVASRRVRVSEGCGATISAHRDPAAGTIIWRVLLDGDRDRAEPGLARAIDHELAELRSQFGC